MTASLERQGAGPGIPLVLSSSPLRHPVYADGLGLRAEHLQVEQAALRALFAFGGADGGPRIVRGLEVEPNGKRELLLGPGLAVDARGRPLLLPRARRLSLDRLVASTAQEKKTAPDEIARLYVLTARHAEGPQGTTPDVVEVEGLLLRAQPLPLSRPLPVSRTVPLDHRHLRSRAAAAVFGGQRARGIVSAAGLAQETWCTGAAQASEDDVPLAAFAWTAGGLAFVDPWIVRRERCDGAPRRQWSALLGHRSWEEFLAEVLQFQCQLADSLQADPRQPPDPSGNLRAVLQDAFGYAKGLNVLGNGQRAKQLVTRGIRQPRLPGGATGLVQLQSRLAHTLHATRAQPRASSLLARGMVELPPAGYLPVALGSEAPSVNEQVRTLTGDGVDLRFCVVRPDVIPHALEEACHLERISLLEGLDDARRRPAVDVLVPDGRLLARVPPPGLFEAGLGIGFGRLSGAFRGAARRETVGEDGAAFYLGGFGAAPLLEQMILQILDGFAAAAVAPQPAAPAQELLDPTLTQSFLLRGLSLAGREDAETGPDERGLWLTMRAERAVSGLQPYESTAVSGRVLLGAAPRVAPLGLELTLQGDVTVLKRTESDDGVEMEASLSSVLSAAMIVPSGEVSQEVRHSRRMTMRLRLHTAGDARIGSTAVDVFRETPGSAEQATEVRHTWDAAGGERVTVGWAQAFSVFESGPLPPLADLTLTPNPDVRRPEHFLHALAESGLNVIARALRGEPTFKGAALRALYPPPAPAEPLIEATRDWVFFHRRRDAQRVPAGRLVAPMAVRYRLFELTADDDAEVARALDQLESSDRRRQTALRKDLDARHLPLVVSFHGAHLADDPRELRLAWLAARPGRRIVQAVAATTRADGAWVQQMRLRRLIEALTGQTAPRDLGLRALPEMPTSLAQPEAEGSLLLITRVVRSGQFVYGVAAEAWPELRRRLEDPALTPPALADALESATALGRVDFYADSARIVEGDTSVAEFYATAFPGRVPVAACCWTSSFATDDERRLGASRVEGLARLLGGAVRAGALPPRDHLPTECDAVAVLVAGAYR
jgi:hypothetical protein